VKVYFKLHNHFKFHHHVVLCCAVLAKCSSTTATDYMKVEATLTSMYSKLLPFVTLKNTFTADQC